MRWLVSRPICSIRRACESSARDCSSDWRQNWAFAKWTLRSYLLGYTAPYVLLWILGLTAGAAAAGVLGICNTLIGMTNVLVMGVDNVLTPQATHAFATGGTQGLRRILLRTGAFLTLILGGLFCLSW